MNHNHKKVKYKNGSDDYGSKEKENSKKKQEKVRRCDNYGTNV